jgi:hypothetical protein
LVARSLVSILLLVAVLPSFATPQHEYLVQLIAADDGKPITHPVKWDFQYALVDVAPHDLSRGLWRLKSSHQAFEMKIEVFGFIELFPQKWFLDVGPETVIPIELKRNAIIQINIQSGDGTPAYKGAKFETFKDGKRVRQESWSSYKRLLFLPSGGTYQLKFTNEVGEERELEIDTDQLPWFSKHTVAFENLNTAEEKELLNQLHASQLPSFADQQFVEGRLLQPDGKPVASQKVEVFNSEWGLLSVTQTDDLGWFKVDVSAWDGLDENYTPLDAIHAPFHIGIDGKNANLKFPRVQLDQFGRRKEYQFETPEVDPILGFKVIDPAGKPIHEATVIQTEPDERVITLDAQGHGQLLGRGSYARAMIYRDGFDPVAIGSLSQNRAGGIITMHPTVTRTIRFNGASSGLNRLKMILQNPDDVTTPNWLMTRDFEVFLEGKELTYPYLPKAERVKVRVDWEGKSYFQEWNTLSADAPDLEFHFPVIEKQPFDVQLNAAAAGTLLYAAWTPETWAEKGHRLPKSPEYIDLLGDLRGETTVDRDGKARIQTVKGASHIWLYYFQKGVGYLNEVVEIGDGDRSVEAQVLAFAEVVWRVQPRIPGSEARVVVENSDFGKNLSYELPIGFQEFTLKNVPPGTVWFELHEGFSETFLERKRLEPGERVVLNDRQFNSISLALHGQAGPLSSQTFLIEPKDSGSGIKRYMSASDDEGKLQLDSLPDGTYKIWLVLDQSDRGEPRELSDMQSFTVAAGTSTQKLHFNKSQITELEIISSETWQQSDRGLRLWDLDNKRYYDVFVSAMSPRKVKLAHQATHHLYIVEGQSSFARKIISLGHSIDVKGEQTQVRLPTHVTMLEKHTATLKFENTKDHFWYMVSVFKLDNAQIWQPYASIEKVDIRTESLIVEPGDYLVRAKGSHNKQIYFPKDPFMAERRLTIAADATQTVDLSEEVPQKKAAVVLNPGETLLKVRDLSREGSYRIAPERNKTITPHLHPFDIAFQFPKQSNPTYIIHVKKGASYVLTIRDKNGQKRTEEKTVDKEEPRWDFRTSS